jgi:alpha-tubulin suppressor-like RCC1 family protein
LVRATIFVILAALITGFVGCSTSGEELGPYQLTISCTPGGNVTEPGKGIFVYDAHEVVDLVAVSDEHYHFVEWTGDVDTIADVYDASTNIIMNDSYSITANFELDEGWCSLTIYGTQGGLVTQPGEGIFVYAENTTVALIADPDEHCHFVNWTGDVSTIANIYGPSTNITMTDSYSITGNFELDEGWYRLTISSTLGGSIVEPIELISVHAANTTVVLVAQPDEGYEFVTWTGDVGTITDVYNAATDISMYDSYTITANFAANFMVAAGGCTVGLRSDGRVLAVGSNHFNQCNVGSWKDIVQVAPGTFHTVGLKSDGTVVAAGWNDAGQCNVGSWTDIIQVAAGDYHTVGLRSDGTVVAVGSNEFGQCNVGGWTNIIQIDAGGVHTVGLKSDGTVVAVGWNDWGQRNVGGWTDIVQVSAGSWHTVGLRADGTVVAVGDNSRLQRNVGSWTEIIQVAAGGAYTVGLKRDGTVVAVGDNYYGQCNVGSWTLVIHEGWYSLVISSTHGGSVTQPGEGILTYAANTTVALVAQPNEEGYQFQKWTGDVDTIDDVHATNTSISMYDSYFITAVFGWFNITQIDAGLYHTVGLKNDGTVIAVGHNLNGQCGVSNWTDIIQVSAGGAHTVGLKADGTVVAVGDNGSHEAYVSNWTDIVQVAAGYAFTVGLKSDGTVVAGGDNGWGQCNVSGWTDIIQVAAGGGHTVGLKADGTVVAVGYNYYGQCNVGSWTGITQVAAGDTHTLGLKNDHTVIAVGNNAYGQCNVGGWTGIIQVAADRHTAALKSNGTVVAVGVRGSPTDYNPDYGQCDVGSWTGVIQVATGAYHTVGLKSDDTVVAVGDNTVGQCNVGG